MRTRPKVSVLVNTCNEASVLKECLESVKGWADEIIVCDMESSDDSVSISKNYGAIVWNHKRMPAPEPEAMTFGMGKCSGDWILKLDPDSTVSPRLRERLDEIMLNDSADIVDLFRINFCFTKWCSRGHGSDAVFRQFFKRSVFNPVYRNMHSFWHDSLSGRVTSLSKEYAIMHYAYPTIEHLIGIITRYARCEADVYFSQGRKFSLRRILWKPLKRFVSNYFIRRGFLDGMPGLITAVVVAGYLFLIEAYIWELSQPGTAREGRVLELG
jgi:glycosyltransferase involved in cell wall biosynthesis